MENINAREAQNHFGTLLNKAMREPVTINKYGQPLAVLMSYEEYEKFSGFEDLYWEIKAKEAAGSGFLDAKESAEVLNKIING